MGSWHFTVGSTALVQLNETLAHDRIQDKTSAAVCKALELEHDYPLALSLLGYVRAMKGDFVRAVEVSEKAVMLAKMKCDQYGMKRPGN